MNFKLKCMYLAKHIGKTRNGDEYKQLKFLDKDSNDTIVVYVNDFGRFDNIKPYSDIEVIFNLYKDSKGVYRLSLGDE